MIIDGWSCTLVGEATTEEPVEKYVERRASSSHATFVMSRNLKQIIAGRGWTESTGRSTREGRGDRVVYESYRFRCIRDNVYLKLRILC